MARTWLGSPDASPTGVPTSLHTGDSTLTASPATAEEGEDEKGRPPSPTATPRSGTTKEVAADAVVLLLLGAKGTPSASVAFAPPALAFSSHSWAVSSRGSSALTERRATSPLGGEAARNTEISEEDDGADADVAFTRRVAASTAPHAPPTPVAMAATAVAFTRTGNARPMECMEKGCTTNTAETAPGRCSAASSAAGAAEGDASVTLPLGDMLDDGVWDAVRLRVGVPDRLTGVALPLRVAEGERVLLRVDVWLPDEEGDALLLPVEVALLDEDAVGAELLDAEEEAEGDVDTEALPLGVPLGEEVPLAVGEPLELPLALGGALRVDVALGSVPDAVAVAAALPVEVLDGGGVEDAATLREGEGVPVRVLEGDPLLDCVGVLLWVPDRVLVGVWVPLVVPDGEPVPVEVDDTVAAADALVVLVSLDDAVPLLVGVPDRVDVEEAPTVPVLVSVGGNEGVPL